jgi:flavorubredoxin
MPMVLGPTNERLSKVCEAMAFALGTPAATSATQAKMGQFLAQIKAKLPAEQLAQLVSSIDPTQQQKLQAALEQVQP